jgi:hypothetical protein
MEESPTYTVTLVRDYLKDPTAAQVQAASK